VLKIAIDGEVVDVKIDPFGQNVQKPDPMTSKIIRMEDKREFSHGTII
jgi:hypothetical protein